MRRVALLLCLMLANLALAETQLAPQVSQQVPPEILKEFQVIEELAAKSAFPQAVGKAEALLPRLQDIRGARALLLRNLAALYGLQKHYAHAAHILEDALVLNALSSADASKAYLELGQYYTGAENYPKAAEALTTWIDTAQAPKPEHYLLLADIRTRLKQYPQAAALVEKAIADSPQPKQEWYQLLLGLYHEARDFEGCIRILETLIDDQPDNPQYWNQLTGIFQEAGKEQQALAVQQLMYRRGLLKTQGTIIQLVQVLRFQGLHSRAADLLQAEIDHGAVAATAPHLELLGTAWTEAKEYRKAGQALERAQAVSYSPDTQHRLGQIYSELHDWGKAEDILALAVARGGLNNPGGAYLLLGLAQYRLNAKEKARAAFVKASQAPTVRKTAQQWLDHLDAEAKRGGGRTH